jgi:hypothetical protein
MYAPNSTSSIMPLSIELPAMWGHSAGCLTTQMINIPVVIFVLFRYFYFPVKAKTLSGC